MNITIDASVFVAASKVNEKYYLASRRFLQSKRGQCHELFCPLLVLPECAAAISRPTANAKLAEELVTLIINFPRLRLVQLDMSLAQCAVEIARDYRLRGDDSVYVGVAVMFDSLLISWDAEMLERGAQKVTSMTPLDWIEKEVTAD
ncbi:MAG: PIN domain-containing protein [Anaerolineales bacterium]|nr:PIN domain-containing protein [Anaerolineales bacterium]